MCIPGFVRRVLPACDAMHVDARLSYAVPLAILAYTANRWACSWTFISDVGESRATKSLRLLVAWMQIAVDGWQTVYSWQCAPTRSVAYVGASGRAKGASRRIFGTPQLLPLVSI
ncbi:hypothetical protein BD626DRAFT_495197 [Schizophyllum amplum]|uniref:Uncharacterized protein n=1 Tax=Schizophyllum amplum TaxID=97359 RepID=A0A550CFZ5_9AGAR|nr:hypothetical protein BD626DRAFT_495197 [Auriculariopsis ampla]